MIVQAQNTQIEPVLNDKVESILQQAKERQGKKSKTNNNSTQENLENTDISNNSVDNQVIDFLETENLLKDAEKTRTLIISNQKSKFTIVRNEINVKLSFNILDILDNRILKIEKELDIGFDRLKGFYIKLGKFNLLKKDFELFANLFNSLLRDIIISSHDNLKSLRNKKLKKNDKGFEQLSFFGIEDGKIENLFFEKTMIKQDIYLEFYKEKKEVKLFLDGYGMRFSNNGVPFLYESLLFIADNFEDICRNALESEHYFEVLV